MRKLNVILAMVVAMMTILAASCATYKERPIRITVRTVLGETVTKPTPIEAKPENVSNSLADRIEDIDLDPLFETMILISEKYADPVSNELLVEGAIRGVLEILPEGHSHYMSKEEQDGDAASDDGYLIGIGIGLEVVDGKPTVMKVMEGGPAHRAGLKVNDIILKTDGKDTGGLTATEITDRIRGKEGTKVVLTVQRTGWSNAKEFKVQRAKVNIIDLTHRFIDRDGKRFSYIKMDEFSTAAKRDFRTALYAINGERPDGIILDLRGNPGGLVSIAKEMVGAWTGTGQVVMTTVDHERTETDLLSPMRLLSGSLGKFPTVVLIDGDSASASEIVAGALQDYGEATIVGTKSFGKGSMQSATYLEENDGLVYLTEHYWLTPNGHKVHGIGITPDITVEQTMPDPCHPETKPPDKQLEAAIEFLSLTGK